MNTAHDECKWARWTPYVWDGRERYPIRHENPMWERLRRLNADLRGEPPCQCSRCNTETESVPT